MARRERSSPSKHDLLTEKGREAAASEYLSKVDPISLVGSTEKAGHALLKTSKWLGRAFGDTFYETAGKKIMKVSRALSHGENALPNPARYKFIESLPKHIKVKK